MRILWMVLVVVALGVGCSREKSPPPPKAEVLAQWHFVGAEAVNADTNGTALKAILALPESHALLEQTLGKLARAPFARFQTELGGQTNDFAEVLRPLLDDLLHAESCFELRAISNQTPEWAVAVRLPAERAEAWRTNLATVLGTWTTIQPTNLPQTGAVGWRLRKHDAPNQVGLTVAGEWVLFGAGQDRLTFQEELAARIKAGGRPATEATNYWLRVVADWPRLAGQPAWLAWLRLPKTDVAVIGRGENLQTRVEMTFPQPHDWQGEEWVFPTNTIRDPVVGFTAVRGFRDRLKPLAELMGLTLDPFPNQACFWGLAELPFQTFAAFPTPDMTNTMARLCAQLPSVFNTNTQGLTLGSWRALTNNDCIVWEGMPFFGGFIRTAQEETNGGFVLAGLFPNTPRPVPAPPELYQQIVGRTNLVYYDWEIGSERLTAWRTMAQLALLLAEKPQLQPETTAMKWLDAVKTNYGNIGTAVTVGGPQEMTLVRNSPCGFTGLETVVLANWLESVTFPWGYELPPTALQKRKKAPPEAKPNP